MSLLVMKLIIMMGDYVEPHMAYKRRSDVGGDGTGAQLGTNGDKRFSKTP